MYRPPMAPPLIRRAVDVVLGDPQAVADRIEVIFGAQDIAVVCRVDETIVKIEVSTLDLADENLEQNIEAWIEQAAADVAASSRWVERD
jgi:hypothetical protein